MRILFRVDVNTDRAWSRTMVSNLQQWMRELNYDAEVKYTNDYRNYDVVIFGRFAEARDILAARTLYKHILIGMLAPIDDTKIRRETIKLCDFLIQSSIEGRDHFMKYCPHVFIMPSIENTFTKYKKHKNNSTIRIAYVGNKYHIRELHPHITPALETLSQERKIQLVAISNFNKLSQWKVGRPAKIDIEYKKWDVDRVEDDLLSCDIGIVPGLTPGIKLLKAPEFYAKRTDYALRFKNESNAGRAFVFHQLGLPVISDFIPSCFHILADPYCGHLAHSTNGWIYALRDLCSSAARRQKIADYAYHAFHKYYNPLDWTERLYSSIKQLHQTKK
ncbi:hypothetical protein [Paenibacillus spongiae]|uniref:Glycosyltransferase family 1 protein n=1 Tax=Paenibacillus spongiae TaxID=2909671 RepID=A0ABY5S8I1_9BACL|nr:hypothetical protein [Paenibacillus spongiae]UVI28633.1 hypothetical protein L1F29_24755 [Paenibacillus spongiae]